ncbi:hypothetical protein CAPN002_12300 [Capnocytophaga stomatis]|uniref:hypothetical protein n=1 Tax=Capnocytophaga stomatis TaxID=1848904 RepID=UPI0019520A81|nr:hypothetical protein [Capnocytophaga stomatis]GIJ94012.1 hypothetical protein CAPN002_12300 [Capnocytophaga stomatis]
MMTEYLGRKIPQVYLDFIESKTSEENMEMMYFNNEKHNNKKIKLYTKNGLLSNSYDKKSYWYEWISKADYTFEKVKALHTEEPISIDEVKTCFAIADTYEGNVFINLHDGSIWHFSDDSDWVNDIDLYHCEKYANSFADFLQKISLKPIGNKFESEDFE